MQVIAGSTPKAICQGGGHKKKTTVVKFHSRVLDNPSLISRETDQIQVDFRQ